jgi:hypothetical protein
MRRLGVQVPRRGGARASRGRGLRYYDDESYGWGPNTDYLGY